MSHYRQGDILLEHVGAQIGQAVIDGTAQGVMCEPEHGRLILARGEVTGHHHSVDARDAEAVQTAEGIFLRIMAPTPLEHQEHAPIVLEPGWYKVTRQREYQPGELPRQVAD